MAIKKIKSQQKYHAEFLKEIKILSNFKNKNIITLLGKFLIIIKKIGYSLNDSSKSEDSSEFEIYLIFEYIQTDLKNIFFYKKMKSIYKTN